MFQPLNFVGFSGYVYDAVWVYALALQTMIQKDETYLQNLHSNRSIEAFVDIIQNIDFHGVSGRINFYGRSSRLSDIDIVQWYKPSASDPLKENIIGVFRPNFTR